MNMEEAIEWLKHSLVMNSKKANATIELLQLEEKAKHDADKMLREMIK